MDVPLWLVDAFADRPFAGNPAAVCLLERPLPEAVMQAVAGEMNLSETAFVVPRPRAEGERDLRWFTPSVEVDLCGHATLAAAHVLWGERLLDPESTIRFHTRSGVLTAVRRGDRIFLDFPAEPAVPTEAPAGLAEALGVSPRWVGRNRMDLLVELGTEAEVRAATPDMAALRKVPTTRGIIVTAPAAAPPFDFVSRFFAPAAGVDEDPVTGSAHCALGPFWSARLGRAVLFAHQVSPRGGTLEVESREDRVLLGGRAVTVVRGSLRLESLT
jgi:PhzF family phenazine biosynthesis protein